MELQCHASPRTSPEIQQREESEADHALRRLIEIVLVEKRGLESREELQGYLETLLRLQRERPRRGAQSSLC